MINVTIDRKRWGTGEEGGFLLNPENKKMCCLGFVMRQAGYKASEIFGISMPDSVTARYVKPRPRAMCMFNETAGIYDIKCAVSDLATVNDNGRLDNKDREFHIKALGKKIGINFKFVGKKPLTKKTDL